MYGVLWTDQPFYLVSLKYFGSCMSPESYCDTLSVVGIIVVDIHGHNWLKFFSIQAK